jgi:hypothetical protein
MSSNAWLGLEGRSGFNAPLMTTSGPPGRGGTRQGQNVAEMALETRLRIVRVGIIVRSGWAHLRQPLREIRERTVQLVRQQLDVQGRHAPGGLIGPGLDAIERHGAAQHHLQVGRRRER